MKRIISLFVIAFAIFQSALSQDIVTEGAPYYLPKTAFKFRILVQKTTFTPGEYAEYAARYLKQTDAVLEPKTSYKIIDLKMQPIGVPDPSKHYTAKAGMKYNIQKIHVNDNGVLLSVNTDPAPNKEETSFSPARKPVPLNPRDYMSEDILAAGSRAKMAQLCAEEIYTIRTSRNDLTRGTAETMPKDGEQLKLMLASLNNQEKALRQLFEGITEIDTTEHVITVMADAPTTGQLAFRFSEAFGITDNDDFSGSPYYLSVTDLQLTPEDTRTEKEKTAQKEDPGLYINVPGKAHVALYNANKTIKEMDVFYPQFGRIENLSASLFNKKVMTTFQLNQVTGTTINLNVQEVGK